MLLSDVQTIYLTNEQIYRLVEVANDALIGVQIHTNASDQSDLTCEAVQIDNINFMRHFLISADGKKVETT